MRNHDESKVSREGPQVARNAGLRYVTDSGNGICRASIGKNFNYTSADGDPIKTVSILRRIKSLAIPPAWKNVWICPLENGHLQATGRDNRGRKQYRYHPWWRETRDETKFARMLAFAKALPMIRRRVTRDLRAPDLSRRQVLAAIVQLLEKSLIRVGNDEYARQNHSYGLTTMRNRHARINGASIRFQFRGKSGKEHNIEIHNARLARIVRDCRDIPGQDLFQYFDSDGERQQVRSEDVNEYLREVSGGDFTAKDFRTWAGTVLAGTALREFQAFESSAQAKKNLVQAIESVAARLGNTPAICKKCYIHPEILEGYLQGATMETTPAKAGRASHRLRPEEASVVIFLRKRLAQKRPSLETALKRSLRQATQIRGSKRG